MNQPIGKSDIEATDLTPIPNLTAEDEAWIRQLAQIANTTALKLKLFEGDNDEDDPIVRFDERSGKWWAGRYIGEVHFQGRTLRILPRFGMPLLQRWLSCIWGVRLFLTKGKYENSRVWLWQLLAKLWEAQLLIASKHGLPTKRFDELHYGQTLRGRIQTKLTADEFSTGSHNLVSQTRNRHIDNRIGGIIVHAFEILRRELRYFGDERSWLTQHAQNLTMQFRSYITRQQATAAAKSQIPIRYTPITENYRSIVELSLGIIRHHPFSSAGSGSSDVLGILIDMAEVWELYVYHLLRTGLQDVEVIHAGRNREVNNFLLRSTNTQDRLGGLKPDILVCEFHTNRLLAILDAKYKTTTPSPERPRGILREDLYQLASYLASFGNSKEMLSGGLVYPATQATVDILDLQDKSPWKLSGAERQLWFFGMISQETAESGRNLTPNEWIFVKLVQDTFQTYRNVKQAV